MLVRRAVLRDFDAVSYRAIIEMTGSIGTWLSGVPVSRAIPGAELVNGRYVAVLIFDAGNPNDTVITAVWT